MRRALLLVLPFLFAGALLLLLTGEGSSLWDRGASRSDGVSPAEAAERIAPTRILGKSEAVTPGVTPAPSVAPVASDDSAPGQANVPTASGDGSEARSPHGQIRGRVVDYEGRPVKGAIVSWAVGCTSQNHTTGEDGRFLLDHAPVTWHHVRVMAPHGRADLFNLGFQKVRVPRDGAEVEAGDLVLPLAATLRVEVEEQVETAAVSARLVGGEHEATGYMGLGDTRHVELAVPPGRYEVLVNAGEELRWAKALVMVPPEGTSISLALRPGARVRARIVDASGAPVRASIVLEPLEGSQLPWEGGLLSFEDEDLTDEQFRLSAGAYATNDANGHYESKAQIPGRYRLVAVPLDLGHGRVEATVTASESAREITLVAPSSRSIAIRATEELSDAKINAWGPPGLTLEQTPTGDVLLHGLLPGDRALILMEGPDDDDYQPQWVGSAWASAGSDVVVTTTPPATARVLALSGQGQPQGAGYQIRIQLADTQGLEWRADLDTGGLSFDFDDEATEERTVGERGFVDRSPSIQGYPYDWVTETRPDGASETLGLVPGRWSISQLGEPKTTVELRSDEEHEVRITVR